MTKYSGLILGMATLVVISGCQLSPSISEAYAGKLRDNLVTRIGQDGTKLFTYSLRLTDPVIGDENRRPTSRKEALRMERESRDLRDLIAEQTELGLEKTLEMSGYCRQGYIELSRLIASDRGEIRGECNEAATAEDRQKFTNHYS
ncbi:hypothetical protein KU855_13160 [Shewanella sp. NIFS-20-20]|nr:hypothetical protein [Shewanella sp. NIFS-20-20]MBV7316596.1 hypothetical protein [Shewanella sp. NIFS-20-20]